MSVDGYLLETLASGSWRRCNTTYWTFDEAVADAKRFIRRGRAIRVRILPLEFNPQAVADVAKTVGSRQLEVTTV